MRYIKLFLLVLVFFLAMMFFAQNQTSFAVRVPLHFALMPVEQSATTEEITRRTESIKELTTHVTESAQRSNEVVAELLGLSQQLTKIVDDLQKG